MSRARYGDAAIAVELDLKSPLLICRQRRDCLALHGFNELRFCALPNRLAMGRNCVPVYRLGNAALLSNNTFASFARGMNPKC